MPAVHSADLGDIASSRRDVAPSISCILPAFNEGETLPSLLTALSDELRQHFERWEIIVVNDGSSDDTEIRVAPWLRGRNVRYVSL